MIDHINQRPRSATSSRSRTRSRCSTATSWRRSTSARSASTRDDFATAMRAAMRQDPDVILVGEMRDEETVAAALSAAETGHLVLSTLHTIDARRDGQPHRRLLPAPPAAPGPRRARRARSRARSASASCRPPTARAGCGARGDGGQRPHPAVHPRPAAAPARCTRSSPTASTTACRPSTRRWSSCSSGA